MWGHENKNSDWKKDEESNDYGHTGSNKTTTKNILKIF